MSSLLKRSLTPMNAAFLAVVGLSACSSSKSGEASLSDDSSISDLEGSQAGFDGASKNQRSGDGRAYRKSVRPSVHSMPIKSGSHWLNAYYFVTSDSETWQSLATRFYDSAQHAEFLKNWNQGQALKAGSIVYYNSPFRPQDREKMLSFSEDFGQPMDQYSVRAGDSLSKIAGVIWGNIHAWPAIAAANPQITHPDVIEIGETLFLPPTVNSSNTLAKLTNSPNLNSLESQMDDSLPQLDNDADTSAAASTASMDAEPPAGPRTPMRSSTMILVAGVIMVLASLIYFLWKRAQQSDPYSGSLSKMDRLTSFFKTKSGT